MCMAVGVNDLLLLLLRWGFFLVNGLGIERVAFRGQAASGCQFKLPAVHCAGQDAVLYFGEAGQVGFEMGAAALDAIAVAFPELIYCGLL